MKPKRGYIWIKALEHRWTVVFNSLQELRLMCGEIPGKEIREVTIEAKETQKRS